MTIYVYRNNLGDCTNNGLSSRFDRLEMIEENEVQDWELKKQGGVEIPVNLVVTVLRDVGFSKFYVIIPFDLYRIYQAESLPVMFGGNFTYSSDSRFGSVPLMIFDRIESWKQYEELSK